MRTCNRPMYRSSSYLHNVATKAASVFLFMEFTMPYLLIGDLDRIHDCR